MQGKPNEKLGAAQIASLRELTPGCGMLNHLNHAGASLVSETTLQTTLEYQTQESVVGAYELAADRHEDLQDCYVELAELIGASSCEIARQEHATQGWYNAFWALGKKPGQVVLIDEATYGSSAMALIQAKHLVGLDFEVVASDSCGQVDLLALQARLGAKAASAEVAFCAFTHIPTNGGLVNPIAEISLLCNAAGVPLLVDACQSVGQLEIDVHACGIDLLSGTGRKYLRGPRGTGFLYASERIMDRLAPTRPDLGSARWVEPSRIELEAGARRFEHWEFNHAGWLGLGQAAREANQLGITRIESTVKAAADLLRDSLAEAGFEVFDLGRERCGIVTTVLPALDSAVVRDALAAQQINTSVSRPSSTLIDATRRDLPDLLRMSVHYLTTAEEISQAVAALGEISAKAARF